MADKCWITGGYDGYVADLLSIVNNWLLEKGPRRRKKRIVFPSMLND